MLTPGTLQRPLRTATWTMVVLLGVLGTAAPGNLRCQETPASPEVSPTVTASRVLDQTGPIQEIEQPLRQLIGLRWEDERLSLNLPQDYEVANPIVNEIRSQTGWLGGSSRRGDKGYSIELAAEKLRGNIQWEKTELDVAGSVVLFETLPPFRDIQVSLMHDGQIRIAISDRESGYLLRVQQWRDGRFLAQELDDRQVFAESAVHFDAFCRAHPQFTAQRLLPTLRHFGLGNIRSRYSPEIKQRLVDWIAPWQPEDLQLARSLTAALDSTNFADRELAERQLQQMRPGNELILWRLVHDPRFSPEVRARTRKLLLEDLDADARTELQFMDQLVSNLDAEYLIDLIQQETDEERREILRLRLATLMPELANSHDEQVPWEKRLSQHAKETPPANLDLDQSADWLTEQGPLQTIGEHTGRLVKLTRHQASLRVDREHWKRPFAGREIAELSDEVRELLSQHHLPNSWYQAGGGMYSESSAQHPQVLFENLQMACSDEGRRRHLYFNQYEGRETYNRRFEEQQLGGQLLFDKNALENRGRRIKTPLQDLPFQLSLAEKSVPYRHLFVHESAPGTLTLLVTSAASASIVRLTLQAEQAMVQDVCGSRVMTLTAPTFQDLQADNRTYFDGTFFPLLRHLGLVIDDSLILDATGDTPRAGSR